VGMYSIYMGVRYTGTNGLYRTYPFTPLIFFPDEASIVLMGHQNV
jgi:hypothetical protein